MTLTNKNIVIASHVLTTVPLQDLVEYLLQQNTNKLLVIGHPLVYKKGFSGSYFKLFNNSKLVKSYEGRQIIYPEVVKYLIESFLTFYWTLKHGKKWHIAIGINNLNTSIFLLLRILSVVDRVVYYTIDFTPQRFRNRLLNRIYHFLDKVCVRYADITWNVSPRIAEGREHILNMKKHDYPKQIVVPIGAWTGRIPRAKFSEFHRNTLVYAGSLYPHQGIQLVLETIPTIIQKIPSFQFIIVGIGDYEVELKKLVSKYNVQQYVQFKGYIKDYKEVEKLLSQSAVGVALYNEKLDIWSHYADPSKIKAYLSAGLPVITTSVTYIGKGLEKNRCGFVIPYNKASLEAILIRLLTSETLLREYRKNAFKYAKHYDWNIVFQRAFNKL